MPVSTLRRWVGLELLGDRADSERRRVSFRNLVRAHELRALRQPLSHHLLDRIERDASGAPVALYPAVIGGCDARAVVIDPLRGFGQSTITGTGIFTAVIAGRSRAGESLRRLAEDYGRALAEIRAAVRFEQAILSGLPKPTLH